MQTMSNLNTLNLTNNPVLKNRNYLKIVKSFPRLKYFNDQPTSSMDEEFKEINEEAELLDEIYDRFDDVLISKEEKLEIEREIKKEMTDEDILVQTMKKKSKKGAQQVKDLEK